MKYYEVDFVVEPCSQDARDILTALAAEAGFETFEDTDDGVKGYVQAGIFDDSALKEQIAYFPIAGTSIAYEVKAVEDKDWNEQWEMAGFEPIIVGQQLAIHDGRHTDGTENARIAVEIDAKMAFGTGTHETTRMLCSMLLGMDLSGMRVLDCGCGTGILGIVAMKLGAADCFGYDIDEWSVDNTMHNAVINKVRITAMEGDATVLSQLLQQADGTQEPFDLVLANINRNILMADMYTWRQLMAPKGLLLLSGFYADDVPTLQAHAEKLGFELCEQHEDNHWACMKLQLKAR